MLLHASLVIIGLQYNSMHLFGPSSYRFLFVSYCCCKAHSGSMMEKCFWSQLFHDVASFSLQLNDASSAGTCTDVLRPATSLDQPCSEADLLKCARALQSWEEIWTSLGLTYPETMELKHSYSYDYREQKFQMFMLWKRKYGSCANYKTLLQAAQSIHDQQFTAFVRQLLSKVGTD